MVRTGYDKVPQKFQKSRWK